MQQDCMDKQPPTQGYISDCCPVFNPFLKMKYKRMNKRDKMAILTDQPTEGKRKKAMKRTGVQVTRNIVVARPNTVTMKQTWLSQPTSVSFGGTKSTLGNYQNGSCHMADAWFSSALPQFVECKQLAAVVAQLEKEYPNKIDSIRIDSIQGNFCLNVESASRSSPEQISVDQLEAHSSSVLWASPLMSANNRSKTDVVPFLWDQSNVKRYDYNHQLPSTMRLQKINMPALTVFSGENTPSNVDSGSLTGQFISWREFKDIYCGTSSSLKILGYDFQIVTPVSKGSDVTFQNKQAGYFQFYITLSVNLIAR